MFEKSNLSKKAKEPDELQVFRNNKKLGILRVAAHPTIFPCADAISWILKNTDISSRYVFNERKLSIASCRPDDLSKCYHIVARNKRL
jgi:hypothetical protein